MYINRAHLVGCRQGRKTILNVSDSEGTVGQENKPQGFSRVDTAACLAGIAISIPAIHYCFGGLGEFWNSILHHGPLVILIGLAVAGLIWSAKRLFKLFRITRKGAIIALLLGIIGISGCTSLIYKDFA
mgnify:CR=1 FL=1